jgi:acyl-CoA synthetase (AMP-forming)/AMP-acid ligase II
MPTIGGAVIVNAQRVPDREAIVTDLRRWTWRQLDSAVAHAAGGLHDLGLRRGDRLAILAANSADFVIAAHAGSRLVAIVVPINTRLVPAELSYILLDAGLTYVLTFSAPTTSNRSSMIAPPRTTTRSSSIPRGRPVGPRAFCSITTGPCGRRYRRSSLLAPATGNGICI